MRHMNSYDHRFLHKFLLPIFSHLHLYAFGVCSTLCGQQGIQIFQKNRARRTSPCRCEKGRYTFLGLPHACGQEICRCSRKEVMTQFTGKLGCNKGLATSRWATKQDAQGRKLKVQSCILQLCLKGFHHSWAQHEYSILLTHHCIQVVYQLRPTAFTLGFTSWSSTYGRWGHASMSFLKMFLEHMQVLHIIRSLHSY